LTEFTETETKVFKYIDELRESGVTNMYGASPYIAREFPELKKEASEYLSKWMNTFEERHPEGD